MQKAIIFGCGKTGGLAYYKLKNFYDIIAWSDNNASLWGSKKNGVLVVEPQKIPDLAEKNDAHIFVSMEDSKDVVHQLEQYGIKNVFIWEKSFFYSADGVVPLEFPVQIYKKKNKEEKEILDILFIANSSNIRDHKTASAVKKEGHRVHLAYLIDNSEITFPEYAPMYEKIYPIMSLNGLREFVRQSDFDIIHSSSEPDHITPLMFGLGKIIIHDCHDLRSSNQCISLEGLTIEYLAHSGAAGILYPTKGLCDAARNKYGIDEKKTLVIENYISEDLIPKIRKEKLSMQDGNIHCVYEGGIQNGMDQRGKRYFEPMWLKIAQAGAHVHFYTQSDINYCKYLDSLHENIHYEGNFSSKELAVEMSKYDVGLVLYNLNDKTKLYVEYTSPNKLYEYVNAGLPVAVNDVNSLVSVAEKYNLGKKLDINGDIYSQLSEIKDIQIETDCLLKNKMTVEAQIKKLITFYKQCMTEEKRYEE